MVECDNAEVFESAPEDINMHQNDLNIKKTPGTKFIKPVTMPFILRIKSELTGFKIG